MNIKAKLKKGTDKLFTNAKVSQQQVFNQHQEYDSQTQNGKKGGQVSAPFSSSYNKILTSGVLVDEIKLSQKGSKSRNNQNEYNNESFKQLQFQVRQPQQTIRSMDIKQKTYKSNSRQSQNAPSDNQSGFKGTSRRAPSNRSVNKAPSHRQGSKALSHRQVGKKIQGDMSLQQIDQFVATSNKIVAQQNKQFNKAIEKNITFSEEIIKQLKQIPGKQKYRVRGNLSIVPDIKNGLQYVRSKSQQSVGKVIEGSAKLAVGAAMGAIDGVQYLAGGVASIAGSTMNAAGGVMSGAASLAKGTGNVAGSALEGAAYLIKGTGNLVKEAGGLAKDGVVKIIRRASQGFGSGSQAGQSDRSNSKQKKPTHHFYQDSQQQYPNPTILPKDTNLYKINNQRQSMGKKEKYNSIVAPVNLGVDYATNVARNAGEFITSVGKTALQRVNDYRSSVPPKYSKKTLSADQDNNRSSFEAKTPYQGKRQSELGYAFKSKLNQMKSPQVRTSFNNAKQGMQQGIYIRNAIKTSSKLGKPQKVNQFEAYLVQKQTIIVQQRKKIIQLLKQAISSHLQAKLNIMREFNPFENRIDVYQQIQTPILDSVDKIQSFITDPVQTYTNLLVQKNIGFDLDQIISFQLIINACERYFVVNKQFIKKQNIITQYMIHKQNDLSMLFFKNSNHALLVNNKTSNHQIMFKVQGKFHSRWQLQYINDQEKQVIITFVLDYIKHRQKQIYDVLMGQNQIGNIADLFKKAHQQSKGQ